MAQYNVHEAKSKLSTLLDQVEAGEKVIIVRRGRPVAELVPPSTPYFPKRRLGRAQGQVIFAPGWEQPMPDQDVDEFLEGR